MSRVVAFAALFAGISLCAAADKPAPKSPKEALQAFADLIGSWRGSGTPEGTREEKERGFWAEKIAWEWKFKDQDVWLCTAFEKGKHFTAGELRYLPEKDQYEFRATTPAKETRTFAGKLANKVLTLDRTDDATKEEQRLVVSLLHHNRYLYRYETKPAGKTAFVKQYQVGATKEGVEFASVEKGPECIVSGGLAKIPVTHAGKTYYVCCGGCRDAFRDDPEKFIKDAEKKKP
jgi:YHS domain-containing protein